MVKNNDKWGALSMKDRALLMDMYLKNGIQELSEMKKHYNGIPYRDFNTSDYDYFNASPEMIPTEEGQHWDSRNPYTGQILKSENHPTFDLAVEGENAAGYKIVRGYDGNLYSIPNQPDNYVEEFNSFGEGSWKDTALLGASFIPFVGTGVDIYNLIKEPSWENAGWAALSLGSDVLGLTALKGLAKSAKLAKGVQAVKALEQAKTAEKYAEAVRKGIQLEHTGNPKKIALAAGRRGQAYYDNLVATRQLQDATLRAENLAAKSKVLDSVDKTVDFYGNVINEKDSLKELLYANGGRILDGTETEQTLSGNTVDASKPLESREEFLNKKRAAIRTQALQNSLDRKEPSNPIMWKNNLSEEEWEQDKLARLDYMVTLMLSAKNDDEANFYKAGIEGIQKEVYNPIIYGDNCIYTALDNYGKKYKVAGNDSFLSNPEKYGFKEIKTSDIKPGDLVQKYNPGGAHHMMMFDSYDTNGLPLYNYSSSYTKDNRDIKKKAHYKYEDINNVNNNYRAFTFIGNVEDNTNWNNSYNQYRKDYSSKVLEELKDVPKLPTDKARILDGTEDEQTTTGLPVGAGLATYNHHKYNHAEEAEMYSYLRSRGVPHIQASAIMGNIAVESMLNPEITQIGGGGGYGLIQATDKARKNAFINYDGQPYEFGSNITPETQRQLDYIIDKGLNTQTRGEWRGNHNIGRASVARRKFLEATDVNKASKIFTENYLRPGKPHTKRRKSMSNYFNDNYGITERALEEFENSFLFQNN